MKYFLVAGEQSGDLHGSNLVKELLNIDQSAEIACWGGDLMENAGARLLMHYKKSAFMGFSVILKNLGTIKRNFALCKNHISEFNPDVIILIDYPGFNLRIAEWAKEKGNKVFYYISPKLWAWKEGRVEKVRKYVDRMFIIFPFEVDFYKKHNITVEYYGNPVLDEVELRAVNLQDKNSIRASLQLDGRPVVALLAGSRRQEVESILPQMIKVISSFSDYQFVLAGVKNLPSDLYVKIIGDADIKLVTDKTYEVLSIASAALVASGTATLETALLNTPQVVCYKGDFISMLIGWMVIKVKYISLVNLVMDKEVVKEVLGYLVTGPRLSAELAKVLPGGESHSRMLSDYSRLREILGPAGASERIAHVIVSELQNRK